MEKLQLKMRMLNVAVTEETWKVFDLLIKFWQKMGVKDETATIGAIMTAGTADILKGIGKINARDPKILDKIKNIEISKDGINEMFDVTI